MTHDTKFSHIDGAAGPLKARHPMDALFKSITAMPFLKVGKVVEGRVFEKQGNRLFVDLGACGMGIVYGREYSAAHDIIKKLNPGDQLSAKVVEIDNEEGYVELSLKEAGDEQRWQDMKTSAKDGEILELPVLEANRGGLILELNGVKGFLPASQLSQQHYPRVEGGDKEKIFQELQKLVGTTLKVKILDVDQAQNKLIFTEKGQESAEFRERLAAYTIGCEVEGEITGIVDFGAFMKFDDGLEGLIHISEIDWSLVDDPRNVLKVGEKVRAKIIDIQGDKISLSLKALKEDPWAQVAEKFKKGDIVKGTVTRLNPFGAFVDLGSCLQGLAHVSEFGTEENLKKDLEVGREYDFKILSVEPKERKISLGLVRSPAS